jgi:hypothetical protein
LQQLDAFLKPRYPLLELGYLAHDHRLIMMIAYTAATTITNETPSAMA